MRLLKRGVVCVFFSVRFGLCKFLEVLINNDYNVCILMCGNITHACTEERFVIKTLTLRN